MRYRAEDGGEGVVVATTRPETLLGDTGVAVNPEDGRYAGLVGNRVVLPVLGRRIPVVADEAVDPEFGTGALKVTPGHDPSDFEIGQRHGLPIVNVMNLDGTMNEAAGPYQGQDRFECRVKIVEQLERDGLLESVEPNPPRGGPLRPVRRGGGADSQRPVVRAHGAAGEAGAGGGEGRPDKDRPRAVSPRSTSTGWTASGTGA